MSITFQKRQKELKRQEKQRAKAERRDQRKAAKRAADEAQRTPTTPPAPPEEQPQTNRTSSSYRLFAGAEASKVQTTLRRLGLEIAYFRSGWSATRKVRLVAWRTRVSVERILL